VSFGSPSLVELLGRPALVFRRGAAVRSGSR
jgi:hypothetical protein